MQPVAAPVTACPAACWLDIQWIVLRVAQRVVIEIVAVVSLVVQAYLLQLYNREQ